jgi:very-short-patch-repair endonuclease
VLGRRGDKLIRVDFVFPGTPVVVEALGYRWHRTGAQQRIDTERMNALTEEGFMVLQFTYSQIVEAPETVVASVDHALRRARSRLL